MNETSEAMPDQKPALNMTVEVERISDIERKLDVEIPWDEVKGRLDEAYRELKQGVTLKGFRKGKVPRRMLEQLFGKHVVKEVAQRLVQESIPKALIDNNIAAVSEPKVEDNGIVSGESFKYAAMLQVVPEVEPKDYFGVEVTMRTPEVSEEAVNMALVRKQQELTDFQSVEGRETKTGDVLLVDVIGKMGDKPISLEQEVVDLAEPPREPLLGLAKALTGIDASTEELELELSLPANDPLATKLAEGEETKNAQLLVTISRVSEKIVPELDDEFAKDTGEAETLDELREIFRGQLLEEEKKHMKHMTEDELIKKVIQLNEIPIVPALVDQELERRMSFQKAIMKMHMGSVEGLDEDALRENIREEAIHAVKRGMLLAAVSKKEDIEVQDADLEKKLAEIASSRGQNVARVRSEYEKEGLLDSLRGSIREDKTLDLLMSKANIIMEESSKEQSTKDEAIEPQEEVQDTNSVQSSDS